MKKRLLAVQGPLQFIAGYIAMEWYKKINHGSEDSESVLLMYDFLMPENIEPEFVAVITQLASIQKWHSVIFISSADMAAIMNGKYSGCINKLLNTIGESDFDEIYLARHYCGAGSSLIINAYPGATRITYGDSLGLVGNEAALNSFNWRAPVRSLLSRCKFFLRGMIYGKPKIKKFDLAVLTLPLDYSGTYLDTIPLLIPSKHFAANVIRIMTAQLYNLNNYCDSLLVSENGIYLFLLSNLSASGAMSFEKEVALYLDIIRKIAPKGACILIKPHPRSTLDLLNSVVSEIRIDYKLVIMDDAEFSRIPIELWGRLIEKCILVPIFSTSAINFKYFYDKEVILPMDNNKIKTNFYIDQISINIKDNNMINESIAALEKWDGKSVLWKGKE